MEVVPMFLDFYNLRQQPFGVTPDPAYLYPSQTHCEALDALTDGILNGRGFLALVAEPGMGKTTLLYQVLEGLRDKARAAYLFQTQCNSREFFQYLLSELGVDSTGMGLVAMHNKLNEMLFAEMLTGRRFVLIVDEAQNLDDTVLETIRLLSNFETSNTKLLQIVLAGQPQLGEKLLQKQMAQLLQRITVVKHLQALSPDETAGYIRHRLKIAGHSGEELFEPEALALIADRSEGIPRNINRICFSALMEAHAEGRRTVSTDIIESAGRKLAVAAARPTAPLATPERSAGSTDSAAATAAAAASPQLTYRPLSGIRSRGRDLWAGGLVAILLSVGAALSLYQPGNSMRALRDRVARAFVSRVGQRSRSAATGAESGRSAAFPESLVASEEVDYRLETHGVATEAGADQTLELRRGEPGTPNVNAIEISSSENDARVVVTLDDAVQYDSARISSPERIYFDLHNARLNPSVGQKTVPLENGLLKWLRAAQYTDDVVRLVLDAAGAKDYSAQLISDPYRLVIDVHAQPTRVARGGMGRVAEQQATANVPHVTSGSIDGRISLTRVLGLKIKRIAIDPGHGGSDTGAMGPHGLLEKSLCLDVALRLGQLIEESIAGAQVVYTRKNDKYVSLEERTAIANRAKADLFISIHANSSDSREARGVETYYLSLSDSPESMKLATRENALALSSLHDLPELLQKITRDEKIVESKQLAEDMQTALSERLQLVSRRETNRGVKQAPFVVLTGANMPAILSEISFVSNASDESLLLESSQRQRVAEGLYRGIAAYLDSLNGPPDKREKLVSQNRERITGIGNVEIRNPVKFP
jgi:N-acetylmuramoyl-L-alanine amidase/type II secretory pathway predicted ATPase ExeA